MMMMMRMRMMMMMMMVLVMMTGKRIDDTRTTPMQTSQHTQSWGWCWCWCWWWWWWRWWWWWWPRGNPPWPPGLQPLSPKKKILSRSHPDKCARKILQRPRCHATSLAYLRCTTLQRLHNQIENWLPRVQNTCSRINFVHWQLMNVKKIDMPAALSGPLQTYVCCTNSLPTSCWDTWKTQLRHLNRKNKMASGREDESRSIFWLPTSASKKPWLQMHHFGSSAWIFPKHLKKLIGMHYGLR